MLDLQLNGISVQLLPETTLQRVYENKLFEHGTDEADFTIPVEIPLSEEVRKAIGFADVLAAKNPRMKVPAALISNGVFITSCTATILAISTEKQTVRLSLIGAYGTFAGIAGEKKVSDLALGGVRTVAYKTNMVETIEDTDRYIVTYQGTTLHNHMEAVSYQGFYDYCFPTQMDFAFSMDDSTQQSQYEAAADIFNATDDNNGGFYIDAARMTLSVYTKYKKYGVYDCYGYQWFSSPQFYLSYVVRQCFSEFGFTVEGSVLAEPWFRKIYLANTYAIDRCKVVKTQKVVNGAFKNLYTVESEATTIDGRNHVPRVPVMEFLTQVAKKFNLQYDVDIASQKVRVLTAGQIIDAPVAIDIDSIAASGYEIVAEKTDYQAGYLLKYSISDDRSEGTADDSFLKVVAGPYVTFFSYQQMVSSSMTPGVTTYAYIYSLNSWFFFDGTEWNVVSYNLLPKRTSQENNLQEIETSCAPGALQQTDLVTLLNDIVRYKVSGSFPTSKTGTEGQALLVFDYLRSDFVTVNVKNFVNDTGSGIRILNDLNKQQCLNAQGNLIDRPCGSVTAYTPMGTMVAGIYHLPWDGPDWIVAKPWIYRTLWEPWANRVKDGTEVEVNVLFDALTYTKSNLSYMKVRFQSQHFLVKKAEVNMPFPEISKLTLVRI